MDKHDVFISYSSIDFEFADRIRDLLQSKGISCWMAPYSIPFGKDYTNSIPDGIGNCCAFILLLSEHSMQSKWVPKELDSAISLQKRIIPFRIDDSMLNMSFTFCLINVQRIEAYSRFDAACEELVRVVRKAISDHEIACENLPRSDIKTPVLRSQFPSISSRDTIGRSGLVAQIAETLDREGRVALWGMGGIGKSKVAKAYILDAMKAQKYRTCVWLDYKGSMKDTLLHLPFDYLDEDRFRSELQTLFLGETCDAVSELSKYKQKLLTSYGPDTLLIIDEIDQLTQEDYDCLNGIGCHLIFITRTKTTLIPAVEVGPLSRDDLRKVFFVFYEDGDIDDNEQVRNADRLIEAVGRHTLTVKMLALYAQLTGTPLNEIYEELTSCAKELYIETLRDETGRETSLDEQFDRLFNIYELSKLQQTILNRLSILPSLGIKKYTFRKICPESLMLDVDSLIKMGWIRNDGGMISIHPLVSHCVHRRSGEDLLDECEPMIMTFIDTLNLTGIESLLSQENDKAILKSMLNYIGCDTIAGIRLYMAAGIFINTLTYQHMIVGETKQEPSFFSQLVNVGQESMAEYSEALRYLRSAEHAYKTAFEGTDDVLLSDIYDGLGACYFNMNSFAEARRYHLLAYELRRKLLPDGDEKLIISARRRAIAAFYKGNVSSAEEEFEENLENLIHLYSNSDTPSELVELAKGYSYVGKIKLHLGHTNDAIPYFQTALNLIKKAGTESTGRRELEELLQSIN